MGTEDMKNTSSLRTLREIHTKSILRYTQLRRILFISVYSCPFVVLMGFTISFTNTYEIINELKRKREVFKYSK